MKLSIFFASLFLSGQAFAELPTDISSPGNITVSCSGNLGSAQVAEVMQFGGANLNKQDFAVHDGVFYAIQLGSYKGFIDILLFQETRDEKGNILSSSYVRTHGGTELDLVDNVKGIALLCNLGGPS